MQAARSCCRSDQVRNRAFRKDPYNELTKASSMSSLKSGLGLSSATQSEPILRDRDTRSEDRSSTTLCVDLPIVTLFRPEFIVRGAPQYALIFPLAIQGWPRSPVR